MKQALVIFALLGIGVGAGSAQEQKHTVRQITNADSVMAVYFQDIGLTSSGMPAVIFLAWPDGHVVWSGDRLKGGVPYRFGHTDPKKFAELLSRFDKDGLFSDEKLNQAHFGPDSQFITVLVKSGAKKVKMESWHELFEESGKLVADEGGVRGLEGRRRFDLLRKSASEYLFFRLVWCETRGRLVSLKPDVSTASAGRPGMKAGILTWEE